MLAIAAADLLRLASLPDLAGLLGLLCLSGLPWRCCLVRTLRRALLHPSLTRLPLAGLPLLGPVCAGVYRGGLLPALTLPLSA